MEDVFDMVDQRIVFDTIAINLMRKQELFLVYSSCRKSH